MFSAVGEAMEEERNKHREEFVKLQQKYNNEAREHSKTGDVIRQDYIHPHVEISNSDLLLLQW